MTKTIKMWKKGRGKLGALHPLIGAWKAQADSPMGTVHCVRTFTPILGGAYVQLTAQWKYSKGSYEELAVLGAGQDGQLGFWSFTSDGKRSEGTLADATDIHPEAIGFAAHMPAGLARMAYWPDGSGGFYWAVEAKTKKGWKRFAEHHYTPV
jgi:hypothetical protein